MGIKKDIIEGKEERVGIEKSRTECRIRIGKKRWRIVGIYVNNNIEETRRVKGLSEGGKNGIKTLIRGDFNTRTGEEEEWKQEEEQELEGRGRKLKDKKVHREGKN